MLGLSRNERAVKRADQAYAEYLRSERAARAERKARELRAERERAYSGWLVLAADETERALIRAEIQALRE